MRDEVRDEVTPSGEAPEVPPEIASRRSRAQVRQRWERRVGT